MANTGFHRANNLKQAIDAMGLVTMVGPLRVPHVVVYLEPRSPDRAKLEAFLKTWPEGQWRLLNMDPLPSHDRVVVVTKNLTAEMLRG